jgi:hypothetical protein
MVINVGIKQDFSKDNDQVDSKWGIAFLKITGKVEI